MRGFLVTFLVYDEGESGINSSNHLDLADILTTHYGDSSDTNPYINIDLNSKYFDLNNLISTSKNLNTPLLLNINVRSLHSKVDYLSELTSTLKSNNRFSNSGSGDLAYRI